MAERLLEPGVKLFKVISLEQEVVPHGKLAGVTAVRVELDVDGVCMTERVYDLPQAAGRKRFLFGSVGVEDGCWRLLVGKQGLCYVGVEAVPDGRQRNDIAKYLRYDEKRIKAAIRAAKERKSAERNLTYDGENRSGDGTNSHKPG